MIKIQNLNKYYGDVQILKNVDMEISKGEIFGIIGHSGAGKSTLLRCINGLEQYQDGSLTVEGREVKDLSEKQIRELRKNLGMIFQHFSLLERKTVFENVALPLECFKYSKAEIEKRVMNLLELVGLADKRDAKPRNLSGGQKQRVAIARALALEPKVLLCDEATSALDPNTTKSILALLEDINEKMDITIIVVTHQMEVVKQICTRVAVMEGGKVLEIEDTEDLFLNNTEGLKALIGDEQIVLPEGVNIKIIFPKEIANEHIITNMARTLDFDFNISYGKLEKFREDVLGSLIITVKDHYANAVKRYLDERNIKWEEIKMTNKTTLYEYLTDILGDAFLQTMYMIIVPTIIATILGFILAIILVLTKPKGLKPNKYVYSVVGFVVNIVRSFPFIILLVALIPFTRMLIGTSIGETAAIVPITIGAAPFIARIIENALNEVDEGLIEAAKSFGATKTQIIFKVMIKEAMPSIISGITLSVISILGYTAMAGTVGAGGLGKVALVYGHQRFDTAVMIYVVITLVIIVQAIQMLGDYAYKKLK